MSKRYIEEGDPIETKVTPAQPAFTSTGVQLSMKGDVFGLFEFQASIIVDDTSDEMWIHGQMDMLRRVFERQRAVIEHRQYRLTQSSQVITLKKLPEMRAEWLDERSRLRRIEEAKFQLEWNRKQARGEFRLSAPQRSFLEAFDAATQKKLDEFDVIAATFPDEIKINDAKRRRCLEIMSGQDKTDGLDELLLESELNPLMLPPDFKEAAE